MVFYAVLAAAAVVAGIIQTVTGFGAGIFMMMFLPLFLPVLSASALSSTVTMVTVAMTAWHYRKYLNLKLTLMPGVFFLIVSSTVMYLAPYMPTKVILKIFGVFLLCLSIYFLVFPDKLKLKASVLSASICASLSGAASGLFGIGGPPMVIYFLAVTNSKEEYLGTIQFFFTITGIYNCIFRVVRGTYTVDLIPYTLVGMAAMLIGRAIGQKIIDRINANVMKKLIYIYLGISGILNLIK